MAFSNWGGKVFCNGVAMENHCDEIPMNIVNFIEISSDLSLFKKTYHAILGDSLKSLVLLYKTYIYAIIVDDKVVYTIKDKPLDEIKRKKKLELVFDKIHFSVKYDSRYEVISVEYTDHLNRKWFGSSGYMVGEGFGKWG